MKRPRISDVQQVLAGRFRLQRELGHGAVSTVFLAEDLTAGGRVAVKVLGRGVASRIMRERFHREMEIGSRLRHPNIVPITDGGEVADLPFLVMPYLEEGSLRARIARGPLSCADAVTVGSEVAEALAYAHAQDVLHRDIKPDNILFDEGRAVVGDFGVALAIKASLDDRLTMPGQLLGTPTYMSPEQAMRRFKLDGRTDLYALACVLYETLVGVPPFVPSHPDAVSVRRSADPLPPIAERRSDVPAALGAVIERGLAWEPADRFATVEEFRSELRAALP